MIRKTTILPWVIALFSLPADADRVVGHFEGGGANDLLYKTKAPDAPKDDGALKVQVTGTCTTPQGERVSQGDPHYGDCLNDFRVQKGNLTPSDPRYSNGIGIQIK